MQGISGFVRALGGSDRGISMPRSGRVATTLEAEPNTGDERVTKWDSESGPCIECIDLQDLPTSTSEEDW